MLTVFTTSRPFLGHFEIIQRNAIQSWLRLRPACEVILFGNEEGTAETAAELGIKHVPVMEYNEYGTPLLNSLLGIAQDIANHELLCYVNADIILMSDFLTVIRQVQRQSFLLIGQRWDVDLKEPVDFDKPDWEAYLQARVDMHGKLHSKSGIDYLVFPRGLYRSIPPFAVGRGGSDNWLVYRARHLKVPVIDATKVITAIHQNHDYPHNPEGRAGVWEGPERKRNIELMGGIGHAFSLEYATLLLTPQGLGPGLTLRHLYFRMRAIPMLYPRLYFLLIPFKVLEKSLRTIRSIRARLRTN